MTCFHPPPCAGEIIFLGEQTMMTEKQKIEKWDLVDNTIFKLIRELNPSDKEIKWDIKPISEIRDVLANLYVKELKLCTESKFYP